MSRTLPNLGLKGGYINGVTGWGDEMNANLLKISTLLHGQATGIVSAVPVTPSEGNVVILDAAHPTNPNAVAVYDNAIWYYFAPRSGWLLWNTVTASYSRFTGTSWVEFTAPGGGGGGGTPRIGVSFHWTGSAVVVDKSSGVVSVVRVAVGRYTITFAIPFPDLFYGVVGSGLYSATAQTNIPLIGLDAQGNHGTTSCDIAITNKNDDVSRYDPGSVTLPGSVTVFFDAVGT